MPRELIYITGPYSHDSPIVEAEREGQLTDAAVICAKAGHVVFSSITHSAALKHRGLSLSNDAWIEFNRLFIQPATRMLFIKLDGWRESIDLAREIDIFRGMKKPITGSSLDLVERWAKMLALAED